MRYNERKLQTLDFFSRRLWVRPTSWAAAVGIYPVRCSYRYLKVQHRWGYLHRGHDRQGRLVYKLAPRGAAWLLRHQRPAV
jgi:hypothetical protein